MTRQWSATRLVDRSILSDEQHELRTTKNAPLVVVVAHPHDRRDAHATIGHAAGGAGTADTEPAGSDAAHYGHIATPDDDHNHHHTKWRAD